MDETSRPDRRALDGVRVLDLTHQVAGPSATLMLAFLGAEVVKVIAPGSRDSYDPVPFYLNNASKKSVELDQVRDASPVLQGGVSPGPAVRPGAAAGRCTV
jgi:crotonobetainyl-CoA:carnitine CoA-transferase CaiB-like acyl-CoA transferase